MHTWIIEKNIYHDSDSRLADAVRSAGHSVVVWNDDWWSDSGWPDLSGGPVVFHGSLENAARIAREVPWKPGAYCDVEAFECTSWYGAASKWLINDKWAAVEAQRFVENPTEILNKIQSEGGFFVRPNSPLKPFSGRVLNVSSLSMKALDYGFYFDDPNLLVIVSPVRAVGSEWRFVVVRDQVITGSSYIADTRSEVPVEPGGPVWEYAREVARGLPAPEDVWVIDICAIEGGFRLVELNPFSGADLYACDRNAIVSAVAGLTA